jgi:hypothetical protein
LKKAWRLNRTLKVIEHLDHGDSHVFDGIYVVEVVTNLRVYIQGERERRRDEGARRESV